jgi:hypothetical protein
LFSQSLQKAPTSSNNTSSSSSSSATVDFSSLALQATMSKAKSSIGTASKQDLFASKPKGTLPAKFDFNSFAKTANASADEWKTAAGLASGSPDTEQKMEAGNYTTQQLDFSAKVLIYLRDQLETNTKISQQTKNLIKTDIATFEALKENQNASPESIATATKLLLKLKEHTHMLEGGKAMVVYLRATKCLRYPNARSLR